MMNHIIDSLLLGLQVRVRPSILLESALHTLHDTRLRVYTAFIKSVAIILLRFLQKHHIASLRVESGTLLVIHLLDELLPSLQVPDSFVCFLFLTS